MQPSISQGGRLVEGHIILECHDAKSEPSHDSDGTPKHQGTKVFVRMGDFLTLAVLFDEMGPLFNHPP